MRTRATFEVIYDGTVSQIVRSEGDGDDFRTCKKELLEYLDENIKSLMELKKEIRKMKQKNVY